MKHGILVATVVAVTAGTIVFLRQNPDRPADLRDAVADTVAFNEAGAAAKAPANVVPEAVPVWAAGSSSSGQALSRQEYDRAAEALLASLAKCRTVQERRRVMQDLDQVTSQYLNLSLIPGGYPLRHSSQELEVLMLEFKSATENLPARLAKCATDECRRLAMDARDRVTLRYMDAWVIDPKKDVADMQEKRGDFFGDWKSSRLVCEVGENKLGLRKVVVSPRSIPDSAAVALRFGLFTDSDYQVPYSFLQVDFAAKKVTGEFGALLRKTDTDYMDFHVAPGKEPQTPVFVLYIGKYRGLDIDQWLRGNCKFN